MRRQWAASEARAYGWGGVRAFSSVVGMSPNTIRKGVAELAAREAHPRQPIDTRLRLIWRERKPPVRELNRELARWMLDRRVLTEDNLIVRAQKVLAHCAEAPHGVPLGCVPAGGTQALTGLSSKKSAQASLGYAAAQASTCVGVCPVPAALRLETQAVAVRLSQVSWSG